MAGSPFTSGSNNPFPQPPPPNPFSSPYNFGGGGALPVNQSGPGGQVNPPPGNPNGQPPGTTGGHNWDFFSDPNNIPPGNPNGTPSGNIAGTATRIPATISSAGDQFYQALMDQLTGLSQNSGPSLTDLTSRANQQAGLQFDPLIKQLQENIASSKANEAGASGKVGDLYNSLGQALAAQMPIIANQFASAQDKSNQDYTTLQNQIHSNYQGAQASQAAELQKLGIQAALPQSTEKLNRDEGYLAGQAGNNGQALNDSLRLMGQGQQDFAQRASMIAPQQGVNTQADMAAKLLQLENQTNQQIAGYQGQKGAAAAQILNTLQSQYANSANSSRSSAIDDAMKLAQLRQLTSPDIFGHATKDTSGQAANYKGLSGVNQYLMDNSSINEATPLMQAFTDFQNSKDLATLTGPGGVGSPSMETEWQLLKSIAQKENPNISSGALNELMSALAIKFGKY